MVYSIMLAKDAKQSRCPDCDVGVTSSGRHAPMVTCDGVALCSKCAKQKFPNIVELRGSYEALRHFVSQAVTAGLLSRDQVATIYTILD